MLSKNQVSIVSQHWRRRIAEKPTRRKRRPFKGSNTKKQIGPILWPSRKKHDPVPTDLHTSRCVTFRTERTHLKVQIRQPLSCMLHEPRHVERKVYAADVGANFNLVTFLVSENDVKTITIGHNGQMLLIAHFFVHSNERAIHIGRRIRQTISSRPL